MANENSDFLTDWAAKGSGAADDGAVDEGNTPIDLADDDGAADLGGKTADMPADDLGGNASSPAEDDHPEGDRLVPLTALKSERQARKEEREKREAAEKRARELEEQLKAPARQAQPAPEPRREPPKPEDFWENPVAYFDHRVEMVRQEFAEREAHRQQAEFHRAENAMRKEHPDFDEISQVVMEEAQRNPAIVPQIFQSPDPARAMYDLGKQIRDFRQFQTDPESARARMKEELKAELLAELEAKGHANAQAASPTARRPVDLSSKRNAASAGSSAPPDKFNDLFKRG